MGRLSSTRRPSKHPPGALWERGCIFKGGRAWTTQPKSPGQAGKAGKTQRSPEERKLHRLRFPRWGEEAGLLPLGLGGVRGEHSRPLKEKEGKRMGGWA